MCVGMWIFVCVSVGSVVVAGWARIVWTDAHRHTMTCSCKYMWVYMYMYMCACMCLLLCVTDYFSNDVIILFSLINPKFKHFSNYSPNTIIINYALEIGGVYVMAAYIHKYGIVNYVHMQHRGYTKMSILASGTAYWIIHYE